MTSGLCGLKGYDDILTDGVKQTPAQMKATLLKKKNFNEGDVEWERKRERVRERERKL